MTRICECVRRSVCESRERAGEKREEERKNSAGGAAELKETEWTEIDDDEDYYYYSPRGVRAAYWRACMCAMIESAVNRRMRLYGVPLSIGDANVRPTSRHSRCCRGVST